MSEIHKDYLIRPVDTRRDLLSIADLIELCFGNQMDQDGRDYVQQIRRAARDIRYIRWIPGSGEQISLPLHGYVCEIDKKIVGNLTLIPSIYQNRWNYLIANVAVDPDYRRRGIGRELTETALAHVQDHYAHSAWLHVRDDNFIARNLYESLGMLERAHRTTWQSCQDGLFNNGLPEFSISRRIRSNWELQNYWLSLTYPPEVIWNLPINLSRFKPGFWSELARFINNDQIIHWSVYLNKELTGVMTWEPSHLNSDMLWLATNPLFEEPVILKLLVHARHILSKSRSLQINYPAGQAESAFRQAGFEKLNTLIWMEKRFR